LTAKFAKYSAEQKVSAVMACLAIIQQERGWVSEMKAKKRLLLI
jgi:NADH:ubiquinone oxidoreductase subunit E